MNRRSLLSAGWLLTALGAALSTGCVERRYTIITEKSPGAMVLENGKPVGATPISRPFTYYGKYRFTLIRDGFETAVIEERIRAPWYEYFPLDFIAENLIPWTIRDYREFRYELQPIQVVPPEVLLQRSADMRMEGKATGTQPVVVIDPVPQGAPVGPPAQIAPPGQVAPPIQVPPAVPSAGQGVLLQPPRR